MSKKRTILLYGRTNAGKTAQLGELAKHVFKTTKKTTRLYTADKGGTDTIQHLIDLKIIDAVELKDLDPWIFLNKAARGFIRDSNGRWVEGDNSNIGLFAFESLRAFAEILKEDLARKASQGINIGGGSNVSFQIKADNEELKVGGGNLAHFGIVQERITSEVWQSQKLDAPYILWTSSVSKDEDNTSIGKVLGPDVIGKALTPEVPRWFSITARLDVVPAQQGKPERHILHLGNSVDTNAGNATALGNTRYPIDAPPLTATTIEPASIVKALELLNGGHQAAMDKVRKELGL